MGAIGIGTTTIIQQAQAQPINQNTTTAPGQVTNLTKVFNQTKDLQICVPPDVAKAIGGPPCTSSVSVLYQSPRTLALKSGYIDTIWKGVDIAKRYGYKVDGISTYITKSSAENPGSVEVLVAMSRP